MLGSRPLETLPSVLPASWYQRSQCCTTSSVQGCRRSANATLLTLPYVLSTVTLKKRSDLVNLCQHAHNVLVQRITAPAAPCSNHRLLAISQNLRKAAPATKSDTPTSPKIAPATKNGADDSSLSHMKHPVQCADLFSTLFFFSLRYSTLLYSTLLYSTLLYSISVPY